MKRTTEQAVVLGGLVAGFLILGLAFLGNLWGRLPVVHPIPLVDVGFLATNTVRDSYSELVRKEEDISGFDCYACHDKGKPLPLHFDANQTPVLPKEHAEIVIRHGQHNRNNNCYNCHDEARLDRLQTRDGRELTFADSPVLCGSCHGPSYRDWEAGAHGRTSGFWDRRQGAVKRQDCVACHDPHSPDLPPRKPAPAPHSLHEVARASKSPEVDPVRSP